MTTQRHDLQDRFVHALALAGSRRAGDATFGEIVARYGENHRHHHTLDHIATCLGWLDEHRDLARQPAEVELAVWYHDVVYEPAARDNEQRSADLARKSLRALDVEVGAVDRIARHILATRDHEGDAGDSGLLVDLDLTVLGSGPREFDEFEHRIRQEYRHLPDRLYRIGRRRVVERFLDRTTIYGIPALRDRFEAPARANLARLLVTL